MAHLRYTDIMSTMEAHSSPPLRTQRALLFDWGDTLMRVFPLYVGPMAAWPQVAAIPHAQEVLALLQPAYRLCLATNAADSDEAEIRLALSRVGLDQYLDKIYCFRKIGAKKPRPEFFSFILEDLSLPPSQAVMIGDDYDADILGALHAGLSAVWLTTLLPKQPLHPQLKLISNLSFLPQALQELGI